MADAPRVLLIRRRYLGDIVLLGSVLRNLRLHWPDALLTVLTEPAYTGILALNPDVTTALAFPDRLAHWPSFVAALRRARFTHVLDFDNTEKTALITRLTGALLRVCFDRELIKLRYRSLYTHSATVTNAFYDSHHITDTYLELLRPLSVPVVTREVRLVPLAAGLVAAAEVTAAQVRKIKRERRTSLRYKSLRVGPDTPLWNELANAVVASLGPRGDKANLARLLGVSRQRLHLLFIQLLFTGHSPKVKVGVPTGHGGNRLKA